MTQENKPAEPLFTPFEAQPSNVAVPKPDEAPSRKRRSSKKESKPATPKRERKTRVAEAPPATQAAPARKRRKRKTVTTKVRQPRGLKLPVHVVLAATGGLRGDDSAVFEKVLGILSGASKAQRQRVLTALGKVFA